MWYLAKIFKKQDEVVFYCADPLDYEMFKPIHKYLTHTKIVAKNKKVQLYLKERNIAYSKMPVFPNLVIMGRHYPHKFPVNKIIKVGFDHGLYQFKRWTDSKYYKMFDVYFVSSKKQVKTAYSKGIFNVKAIGYPKIDDVLFNEYSAEQIINMKAELGLDLNKITILFSTTWDIAGLSALDVWIDRVGELTDKYNILLTAHTWTKQEKIDKLKRIPNTIYLSDYNITKYILLTDIFVGDYNSLIGEASILQKPIITFKVPESDRSIPEIHKMIRDISIQISTFDEIYQAIEKYLEDPLCKNEERLKANKIMFFKPHKIAGKRAAKIINNLLKLVEES